MPDPTLSVVVPVRDDAAGLRRLLASLAEQTLSSDEFEVIVVDNASRDETPQVAEAAAARIVHEPSPSRARARNTGARSARGRRLAFIDADCVATPTWLEALTGAADTAPLVAGAVRLTTADPPNAIERFERLYRFPQERAVAQGWAATANLLVERAAFDATGGFDVAYRSIAEDADFCVRAGRAGFELAYCKDALVEHPAERQVWPLLKRAFWHGYSAAQASRRLGLGYVAWRHPLPLLRGALAARVIGIDQSSVTSADWNTVRALARASYAMRTAGSVWSGVRRAR